ncbi:MAG TPA: DUF378 domain-containing protein [Acidobacteriota bacterium]|nr:DUF378 domain-containing protein [Acidobacteriota bacterium]
MYGLNAFALLLIIIGGINWGLVGLFDFDLVAALFGPGSVVSRFIYILVGLAALYSIYLFKPVREGTRHRPTAARPPTV